MIEQVLINLHGGSIQMASESGKGTSINIILPPGKNGLNNPIRL
jgi:signal transduction histidine kinase